MRRRTILATAVLVGAPLLIMRAVPPPAPDFAFEDIADLPGFRRLDAGSVSAPFADPFLGIRAPDDPQPPRPLPPAELCGALFGPGPIAKETVPVAAFSDYYCPYCRDLTARLAAREGAGLHIAWHELPLLGDASEAAARAALAADLQGAYPAFQARLLRAAFRPNDAYLTELARSIGIDSTRLISDAQSAKVSRRLATSARAAATLGIVATPALVVGRTLVSGAISEARLDALLARERAEGPPPC